MESRDMQFVAGLLDTEDVKKAVEHLIEALEGTGAIERAIEWINDNMEPMEVFSREKMDEWARLNGYKAP